MSMLQHIALLPVLLALQALFSAEDPFEYRQASYIIQENSELHLSGSSNINTFTCTCNCYDEGKLYNFKMKTYNNKDIIEFQENVLKLHADGMDCGHRGMNNDLYEMLNVEDYPYITIELLKVHLEDEKSSQNSEAWMPLTAETLLTISGVCQQINMNVRVKKLADQKYRCIATKQLNMDDFKLDPPKPMMGLIKVDKEFQIELDLIIRIVN